MQPGRLRELREQHALSQDDLAALAKVHRATIARLERGEGYHPSTIRKLAAALGVEPAALLAAREGES